MKSKWLSRVGLEVHAQISCRSKLFSAASSANEGDVNTNVAFFDCALPGTLPALNRRCVEAGLLTSLALGCNVNAVSWFDRKHYFYSDLPSGYQITQKFRPLAEGGRLDYWVFDRKFRQEAYRKSTGVTRLQLEQDSGASFHDADHRTLVNLNRAGVALMELVTEPNLVDGVEAASFVRELILVLTSIGTCGCQMENGQLRVDANVSIERERDDGTLEICPLTEVKNLNSLKFVRQAIDYEIQRHIKLKGSGESIVNETRNFDFKTGRTATMRDKEVLQDYRYLPEPNLLPLRIRTHTIGDRVDKDDLDAIDLRDIDLPSESPSRERDSWIADYGIPPGDALFIVEDASLKQYFLQCVQMLMSRVEAIPAMADFLMYSLRTKMKKMKMVSFDTCAVNAATLVAIVNLQCDRIITRYTANKLVENMSWRRITDEGELLEIAQAVVKASPDLVAQARKEGVKSKALKTLARLVVERSNGLVEPTDSRLLVQKVLRL